MLGQDRSLAIGEYIEDLTQPLGRVAQRDPLERVLRGGVAEHLTQRAPSAAIDGDRFLQPARRALGGEQEAEVLGPETGRRPQLGETTPKS